MYVEVEQRRPQRASDAGALPTVAVYGLGYVGLPTAAVLAKSGAYTVGVDRDPQVVALVNQGRAPHGAERGLSELVASVVEVGALRAEVNPVPADVHIIAVGTPVSVDRSPDLSAVEAVVRSVATVIKAGDLVVLESTVPPLSCERVVARILEELTGLDHRRDYLLAHCPERVIPGDVLNEIVKNDRVVGGTRPEATEAAAWLYRLFVDGEIIETDARTAEMTKLMENSYRDVNIAFANEMAHLAAVVDVDVTTAIRLANRHPRVRIHEPGIGVGGHCIPVDPWFLVSIDPTNAHVLRASREVNETVPARVAAAVRRVLASTSSRHVTLLGLAYKRDVDDLRESPAVAVARLLALDGDIEVDVVEPFAATLPHELAGLPNVRLIPLAEIDTAAGPTIKLVRHSLFDEAANVVQGSIDALDLLRTFDRGAASGVPGEPENTHPIVRPVRAGEVSAEQA